MREDQEVSFDRPMVANIMLSASCTKLPRPHWLPSTVRHQFYSFLPIEPVAATISAMCPITPCTSKELE